MQLMTAERDSVLKPLLMVAGIVERRHTMPILANVLIRKEGSTVYFITTDLEVQISAHMPIEDDQSAEAITVNVRKLIEILRALPGSSVVKISLDGAKLLIESGRSRFTLQTVSAQEFPDLKKFDSSTKEFSLPANTLKHLINMTHYAMAHQDIRYYLNGSLLVIDEDRLHMVTTDAHRLAYQAVDIVLADVTRDVTPDETGGAIAPEMLIDDTEADGLMALETPEEQTQEQEALEVIVPRKTILELQRMLPDTDEPVQIRIGLGQISFQFADVELISKLVEGKFPDYKRVIDVEHEHHFVVERERLQASLVRAAIVTANEKLRSVRVQIESDQMQISASNAEQENVLEELEVDYAHQPVDLGLNVTYLQEFLSSAKSQTVRWSVSPHANSPLLLSVPNEESFQYIVMPMRI